MKVSFSNRRSLLDDDTRKDVRGRIHFALSRFRPCIEAVAVYIPEVAGAGAGTQRLCRLSVRLKQIGSFSVESVEDELLTAVSRAVDRAARQVQRILDRRRDETRRG